MEFCYRCTECDRRYDIVPEVMLCPECARLQEPQRPLRGVLRVELSGDPDGSWPASVGTSTGVPSYAQLLPVEPEYYPAIPVGNTPLWSPAVLQNRLGRPGLHLKDDTANPTGSLKDRASFLVAAFARKFAIQDVVVASTGNAASSMAGVGAAAGLRVRIFVPKAVPRAKLVQSLQYGADVTVVDGSYDDAVRIAAEYATANGGLSRNTGYNPLTIEGKKTVALELFADLGRTPDAVFVPTGDAVILGGVYKGFEDLVQLGFSQSIPKIYAVQAASSNAICTAVSAAGDDSRDRFSMRTSADSVADSINVGVPANGIGAVKSLRNHGGVCVEVSDDEILDAQHLLAATTGLFAEPAAAASLAGLLATTSPPDPEELTVLLITGSGLKDIDAAARRVRIPQ